MPTLDAALILGTSVLPWESSQYRPIEWWTRSQRDDLEERWSTVLTRADAVAIRRRDLGSQWDTWTSVSRWKQIGEPLTVEWLAFLQRLLGVAPDERIAFVTRTGTSQPDVTQLQMSCQSLLSEDLKEFRLEDAVIASLAAELAGAIVQSLSQIFLVEARARCDDSHGSVSLDLFEIVHLYPMAARRIGELVHRQIVNVRRVLANYVHDKQELEQHFGALALLDLRTGLSDPHNGGRTVSALRFDAANSPVVLFHKPRRAGATRLWNSVVDSFAAVRRNSRRGAILFRPAYAWEPRVRWVSDEELDVDVYYKRAGHLLALAVSLRLSDLHYENVVATRDGPAIIDAETAAQPELAPQLVGRSVALQTGTFTVLDTGLLPHWSCADGSTASDSGGLSARAGESLGHFPRLTTDADGAMRVKLEEVTRTRAYNLPGRTSPQVPEQHLHSINAGFWEAAEWVLANKTQIARQIRAVPALNARVILRATQDYAYVRTAMAGALPSTHAVRTFIESEVLARRHLEFSGNSSVTRAEACQLLAGDIPSFYAGTARAVRYFHNGKFHSVPGTLAEGSATASERHVLTLTEETFHLNAALTRAALSARSARHEPHQYTVTPSPEAVESTPAAERFGQVGIGLVEGISTAALHHGDVPVWVGMEYLAAHSKWECRVLGPSLHSGRAGIALLFASAFQSSGEGNWADRARAAAIELENDAPLLGPRQSVLALYGLAKVALLLDDRAIGRRVLGALQPSGTANLTEFDVMSGSAGAALAYVSIGAALKQLGLDPSAALSLATECGRQLIDATLSDGAQEPRWYGTSGPPQHLGFSHGVAGVGLALARVTQATGMTGTGHLIEGIVNLLDQEYDAANGDWPTREGMPFQGHSSWCHGAPGIGLALQGILATAPKGDVADVAQRNLMRARQRMGTLGIETDVLCCGAAGRIEFLRTYDMAAARALGERVVSRARQSGHFILNPDLPHTVPLYGLWWGLGGVAHTLLRLDARGDDLPCILSLE